MRKMNFCLSVFACMCMMGAGLFMFLDRSSGGSLETLYIGSVVFGCGVVLLVRIVLDFYKNVEVKVNEKGILVLSRNVKRCLRFDEVSYIGKDIISGGGGGVPSLYYLVLSDSSTVPLPRGGDTSKVIDKIVGYSDGAISVRNSLHRDSVMLIVFFFIVTAFSVLIGYLYQ